MIITGKILKEAFIKKKKNQKKIPSEFYSIVSFMVNYYQPLVLIPLITFWYTKKVYIASGVL